MEEKSKIILEESILSNQEEKIKKPRKKVTLDSHLQKYQELLSLIDNEIEKKQKSREPGIRSLQSMRKLIKELENETHKVAHVKRKNLNSKKVSGFSLPCKITNELADFMKLPHGSTPTRNEITNAICVYTHYDPNDKKEQMLKWAHLNPGGKRNLQDKSNKMSIIPDAKLKKLLHYDKYVQDVKDGKVFKNKKNKETGETELVKVTTTELSYSVIQKLIQCQIIKSSLKKEEDEEKDDIEFLN